MDLVESGVVMFVAFVFIGGSMAYFAGPPDALDGFVPYDPMDADPCKLDEESCETGPEPTEPDEDDDGDDDDRSDGDDGERRDKGSKRGKD